MFPNVCAHLVKVGNNRFPCVQTKFGKDTILGGSRQFWSLENTNRKFGVGRSDTVTVCVCVCVSVCVCDVLICSLCKRLRLLGDEVP